MSDLDRMNGRTGRARKAYKDRMTFEHLFELTYTDPETGERMINTYAIFGAVSIVLGSIFYFKKR